MFFDGILKYFKTRASVQAAGFCDGTQGVSPDNRLVELDGHFANDQESLRYSAARPQKQLEALIDTLSARADEAEQVWRKLHALTEGVPPQIALPLLAVPSAAAVVPAEAVFVAPVLDGLGVSDPVEQLVFAGILVLASSGLIKIAIHLLRKLEPRPVSGLTVTDRAFDHQAPSSVAGLLQESGRSPLARTFRIATSVLMILFAVSLVTVLGWWRAAELIFAGSVGGDELGRFLSENPTLTRIIVTLLTIGLPVFAAIAFEYGFDSLHAAWQWRKARRAHHRYSKELNVARKQLEARTAQVEHQVAALDAQREQWRSAYLHNHELGTIVGAHRRPWRHVVLKIAAVAVLIFAMWLLLDPFVSVYIESPVNRTMLAVLLTFGLGGLYAARAIKSWDRPSPEALYKNRRVIWSDEGPRTPPPPSARFGDGAGVIGTDEPARAKPVAPTWAQQSRSPSSLAGFVVPPSGGV